jgi:hypothetical protein
MLYLPNYKWPAEMPQENTEVNFREVLDEWPATTIYFQLRGCVD